MRTIKKSGIIAMAVLFVAAAVAGCGKNDTSEKKQSEETTGYTSSGEEQLAEPQKGDTLATLHIRDYGDITVKLFPKAAPKAVENFLTHAKEGYYDGVTFHRVINDFMIQGGDPDGTGAGGESIWGSPFEDEFVENLLPIRGALCMANAGANTNGSQFFIVQAKTADADSDSIASYLKEQKGITLTEEQKKVFAENGGTPHLTCSHTVFGQVVEGMDVVDAIAASRTDASDRPVSDVAIESITITEVGE